MKLRKKFGKRSLKQSCDVSDYSISLIAPEDLASKVRILSESLGLNFGKYIPHITLCWLGDDIPNFLFSSSGEKTLIQIEGFYVDIDQKGRVWVGLKVRLTDGLVKLRAEHASRVGIEPGEVYSPHLTIGCITEDALGSLNLSPLKDLAAINGIYEFTLHVCHNGGFGKVKKIID